MISALHFCLLKYTLRFLCCIPFIYILQQLRRQSTGDIPISCIKSATLCHASNFNVLHNLMPWRLSTRYQNVEVMPLARKMADYTPDNAKATNSVKFPNLITGYECNMIHDSNTAQHRRYTPNEWYQKQVEYYNEADSSRYISQRVRNNALRIIRDADEKVQTGQYDSGRRLGERINDVNFWRNEIVSELERLLQETDMLQDYRFTLNKAIQDIKGPLHISEECLYYREARRDTELVHDDLEIYLLREIDIFNQNKKILEAYLDKCENQLRNCRTSQCHLELDLKNKENALGIDTICHRLHNFSHGLQYYAGIEKHNSRFSEPDSWMDATNRIVEKSQIERNKSCQLRTCVESFMHKISQEIWGAWNDTNNALAHRISELLEAKNRLQLHFQKVQQELIEVETNLEVVRKAIADKSHILKVAHTRLKARMYRPDIELCYDHAHTSLHNEIVEINHQAERMCNVLKELECEHQKLLKTRTKLEHDLMLKIDTMHIDREKVSGLRRANPINVLFKF